ncbi:MAG: DUF4129 domain-containing protein [Candidatus Dormibacteria bacterium]
MSRLALAVAVAGLLAAAVPLPVSAGSCPALVYQADLASAAAAITATPPDTAAARQQVDAAIAAGGAGALAPVRDDLAALPPQVEDAQQRLTAMAATLAYPPGATCNQDASAAAAQLHRVYASPEFRHLGAASDTGWLQAILDALAGLVRAATNALGMPGALAVIFALTAAVALLLTRRWRSAREAFAAVVPDALPLGDDPAAEWRLSEAAAACGEYREAIRRAFRATLVEVAGRGGVVVDAAWTSRELLARLEVPAHVVVALAAAVSSFDRAWYSCQPVSREDWDTAAGRCRAVRAALRTHAVTPR